MNRGARALVCVMGAGWLAALPIGRAGADEPPATPIESPADFTATASADAFRLVAAAPGAPLADRFIDSGGPVANALVSSRSSRSFASFPYPGDSALTGPGTAAGVIGATLPQLKIPFAFPEYPFAVAAEYPLAPEKQAGGGPVTLSAKSGARNAEAVGVAGSAEGGNGSATLASATVSSTENGAADAVAVADVQTLSIGPLKIARLKSTAQTVLGPAGTIERKSSLEVIGAEVNGTSVRITPSGVVAGGTTLPGGPQQATEEVNKALAAAKLNVRLLPEEQAVDGVKSAAVEVTWPFETPFPTFPRGSTTLTIGAARSAIQVAAAPVAEEVTAVEPAPTESATAGDNSPGLASSDPLSFSSGPDGTASDGSYGSSSASLATNISAAPEAGGMGFGLPGNAEPPTAGTPSDAAATSDGMNPAEVALGTARNQTAPARPASNSRGLPGLGSVYLTLAVLAGAGALVLQLFARIGRRTPWNS